MRNALLSERMNSLKRRVGLLILCLAVVLSACGEQRDGMQTLASREIPFIYAECNVGTQGTLIVANEQGYYAEYPITGASAAAMNDKLCVSPSGRAYVSQSTIAYSSSREDYSSWVSQDMTAGVTGFAATPAGDFMLRNNQADPLYIFQKDSGLWSSAGKSSPTPQLVRLFYSGLYNKLFICDDDSGSARLYELAPAPTLKDTASYSIPLSRIFMAEHAGGFYIGNDSGGLYLNGVLIGALTGGVEALSYAVVSPTEIFAGNYWSSDPQRLFRLVDGEFVTELVFSGGGFVALHPLPPDKVIIGIGATTSSDGLYVYNFKKGVLKQLSTRPVYAVYCRDR